MIQEGYNNLKKFMHTLNRHSSSTIERPIVSRNEYNIIDSSKSPRKKVMSSEM